MQEFHRKKRKKTTKHHMHFDVSIIIIYGMPTVHSSTYKLSGASLPKTLIYISDTARLQRVITACGRISEPQRCGVY